jgi:uncharacterized protein YcaQ
MDRKNRRLQINAMYAEAGAPQDEMTGQAIQAAIADLAEFLGAREVVYNGQAPEGWRVE